MIRQKQTKSGKIVIDLDGTQGNVYAIWGICRSIALQLDLDWEAIDAESKQDGDYIGVLKVMDKYFGDYIVFETSQRRILNALKGTK